MGQWRAGSFHSRVGAPVWLTTWRLSSRSLTCTTAMLDANYAAVAANVPRWCSGHGLYASDHEALNADIVAFIKDRVA
jgi:hypothetical protein